MNDKTQNYLVSVILPVRNAGEYLKDCLLSLSTQSYENFEIIAIDDFSSDNSYQILKDFRIVDKRLRVFRNVKKYDAATCLNRAMRKVNGTFIAFATAEDIVHPERLKKQVAYLLSHKKSVAVGSQCYFLNKNSKRIGKSSFPLEPLHIYQKPLHGISMQFEGVMVNRLLIPKDTLYFNPHAKRFLYSDIFVKLLKYGELVNLPNFLYSHRKLTDDVKLVSFNQAVSAARLWLRSEALFGHRPSFRSFVFPLLRLKPEISYS